MTTTLKTIGNNLHAYSPYHPDLPAKAKKLGGRWDPWEKCWTYAAQDLELVTALYQDIYGAVSSPLITQPTELVTVRLSAPQGASSLTSGIYIGGRCIGSATGRDSGASQASKIIFLEGRITSGGSVKNWRTIIDDNSIFEIRDFPKNKIADIDTDTYTILEVREQNSDTTNLLNQEKEKLLVRLAEIENLLNALGGN